MPSAAFSPFWCWLCAGALLMLLELFTPGFVMIFFGMSAATVALACAAVGGEFGFGLQLALFAVLSVAYVLTLRRFAKRIFMGDRVGGSPADALPDADCAGRPVKVLEKVRPGIPGRVELGDAAWSAVSENGEILPGDDAVVVSRDNLTLKIRRLP